jgi:hypothetical protein
MIRHSHLQDQRIARFCNKCCLALYAPLLFNLMPFLRFLYTLLSLIERRLCTKRIKTISVKIRMIPNQRMLAPMIPRWFLMTFLQRKFFYLQVKYIVLPRKWSQKLIIAHERRFPSMILSLLVLDAVDSGSKTIFAKTMICACKIFVIVLFILGNPI